MRKNVNYDLFSKLRELIEGLSFEEEVSDEEKENAFRLLVDLLIKKGIYKNDGSIYRWRENSIQYLEDVIRSLEEYELQMILTDQENFFQRFIFTPCGKNSSLYALLRERRFNSNPFWNVPQKVLFEELREKTGKSPYEKVPRTVVTVFVDEVENLG